MPATAALLLYLTSFALAAISVFLPFGLLWRSLLGSVLALTAGRLISGGSHWSDQNAGHAIGLAMISMFIVCLLLVLAARLFIFGTNAHLSVDTPARPRRNAEGYLVVDRMLAAFAGATLGLAFVAGAATLLGGANGGRFLDIGFGTAATIAGLLIATRIRRRLGLLCLAFCFVVAAVSFVGTQQSRNVIENAEIIAQGQPWCLVLPTVETEISEMSELGFYSLPKGGVRSHLVLVVEHENPGAKAHWSIRQQRFIEGVSDFYLPKCQPRTDYAAKLANVRTNGGR